MATTGFILAPCQAGKMPLISPMALEITIPTMMFWRVRLMAKSLESEIAAAPKKTINKPMMPPARESIRDSKRNWRRMKYFFAPRAF